MAASNTLPWPVWPTLFIFWLWTWEAGCDQQEAEEVEIFNSDQMASLNWFSDPHLEWNEIKLRLGAQSPLLTLQACRSKIRRTILSSWMERKAAHHILMDIAFAQEEEPTSQLGPLQVHLFETDTPIKRFQNGWKALEIQTSEPFPNTVPPNRITSYLNRSLALSLGSVSRRGFQIGFSYSFTCVLLTSIRLYYKRCPNTVANLTLFGRAGAGSGPLTGSCVKGAVEVSLPVRECNVDGVWGPLQGGCTCKPGHQVMDDSCQACRMGYYKPANDSAGCQLCPANSRTQEEGSEKCDCLQGFGRLATEPADFSCTKPPTAPVNLTAHHHNESVLTVTWDPPHDWGGREEVEYHVECEKAEETGGQWEGCGEGAILLHGSSGLNGTLVSITGLNPQYDYRLSVQAWNDISSLLGAPHTSTATLIIQRWKVPPMVITVSPDLNISEHLVIPAPQHQRNVFTWLMVVVLSGSLLITAIIPIAVFILRRKCRSDPEDMELIPVNPEFSYRRLLIAEATVQQAAGSIAEMPNREEGLAQMWGGLSSSLLAGLKELLVERNRLTLGKELGKGEFGSVYEGVFTPEEGVDIKVAVKTMRVGIQCQEDLHEFLREAEIMKNFDHENVMRLLGVTLQREQDSPLPVPLVILPYMKHGDLRNFLIATRYGSIPMFVPHQSLLRFMIDIAAGMNYLSSQGFLHRDLAARNCMLGDDLRVYVADFGLSKKIYSSNYYRQKASIRVPVKWLALESLADSMYTTKSDVWSFGVTMWEIVSRGRTPYPGVHNHELLDLLRSGHRLKPPEDCDHRLYNVMLSCWDKEPNQRPGFGELGESLKGLLSDQSIEEPNYINQGLEAAAASAATSPKPHTDFGERLENVYLPSPRDAAAAANEVPEEEEGYLKFMPGSADDDH